MAFKFNPFTGNFDIVDPDTGGAGLDSFVEVTITTQMAVNTGYITNAVTQISVTLPVTASVGDVIAIAGKGAGGWRIKQNAGQQIRFGESTTATGVGGALDSTDDADAIELVCTTANTTWTVLDTIGNIDIVNLAIFNNTYSMLFDGVDERFDIDNALVPLASTTTGTWSAWIKATSTASLDYIISFGDTSGSTDRIALFHSEVTGKLSALSSSGGIIGWYIRGDNVDIVVGQWHHIVLVQDGVSPVLYVDGVAIAQSDVSAPNDDTEWFADTPNLDNGRISGVDINGGGTILPFLGNIDEVGFWNSALTAAEATEIYNAGVPTDISLDSGSYTSSADLVAWYRMGDLGTFSTNWYLPEAKSGLDNAKSLLFDGVDEYVNIDDVLTNELATTTVGTWSCWVKPVDSTPSGYESFISFGDTSAVEEIQLSTTTAGELSVLVRIAGTPKFQLVTDAKVFTDNVWTHVVCTTDGVSPVLYVNGVAVAQTFDISTDKTAWFNDFSGLDNGRIGNLTFNSITDNSFNGNIDEVTLWDSDFTAANAIELYADGSPEDATTHSKSANLVTWYKMGDGDTLPTIIDNSTNSNNGTMVNMEAADIEFDAPMLAESVNMENGDRVADLPI